MDNAALFGEVLYALPFGKAIERKLLTDYRVVIRVPGQKSFGIGIRQIMAWISDKHRTSGTLRTDFVSGNMPANKRKIKLDERNLRSAFTT